MIWLLLLALAAVASAERKSYAGYQLFHVTPSTVAEVKYLHQLQDDPDFDFWTEPSHVGKQVDILVTPKVTNEFAQILKSKSISFYVDAKNIQRQLEDMYARLDSRPDNYVFNIDDFNSLADIYSWVDGLPARCRSGVNCQTYALGTNTIQGRQIKAFKISKTGTGRKTYLLDATTHAREWLSTATLLKIMDHFVSQYGINADVTRLVDSYNWLFIPVVNPDGYEHSWTSDRYWRKNRRDHGNGCFGVDVNRNFDFRWGTDGVSHVSCSDTYCGSAGNSEPETRAVVNEYASIASSVRALLTIHAYGNMWMFPWGNYLADGTTCDLADDHLDMMEISNPTANAIENVYNTRWSRGNSCEVIYAVTGATDDYTKGALNVKYTFTAELRGSDFVVLPSQIDLSFQEVWAGVVAMNDAITAKHGPSGP